MSEHLLALSKRDLEQPYPLKMLGYPMTTGYFLIHLYRYLGQVNHHQRLI